MVAHGNQSHGIDYPVVETRLTMTSPSQNTGEQIELRHLGKSFGTRAVLADLSLFVARGEFLAIVGRSGCGKTTLLRILAGLEKPTSGTALFDGKPIEGLNTKARIMFQDARLLPWLDVLANVQLGLEGEARELAADILTDVGLGDRGRCRPGTLSGGQRQRVSLARALAHSPELLLLDEPLASVDALTRLEMQSLIERLWLKRKMTVVLVTHDVEESIALADRVVLLDGGLLRADVNVPLHRPRPRSSASFTRILASIRSEILGHSLMADEESP